MTLRAGGRTGRARAAAAAGVLGLLGAVAGLQHPALAAPGTPSPGDLAAARAQAAQLSAQLQRLEAQQEAAGERLTGIRAQLGGVITRTVTAQQQLDALQASDGDVRLAAARRASALYMAGGVMALYATVLDGSDLGRSVAQLETVSAVLTSDAGTVSRAGDRLAAARREAAALERLTVRRTSLENAARVAAARMDSLVLAQQQALSAATAQVRSLADALRAQQEAQAAAAAQQRLASLGISGSEPMANPYAAAAIAAAVSKVGSPYVFGAEGPDTFDCSGLVQWSYAQAGLYVPRLADQQYFAGTPVPLAQIRPGDLLVYAYDVTDPATIHHVTMYIGGGRMVEAPRTGLTVRVVPVYLDGLYGVARVGVPRG